MCCPVCEVFGAFWGIWCLLSSPFFPSVFVVVDPFYLMSLFVIAHLLLTLSFVVGLASQGKDIVLRFIIESSSFKDFDP
jgi:hypothetical protein